MIIPTTNQRNPQSQPTLEIGTIGPKHDLAKPLGQGERSACLSLVCCHPYFDKKKCSACGTPLRYAAFEVSTTASNGINHSTNRQ